MVHRRVKPVQSVQELLLQCGCITQQLLVPFHNDQLDMQFFVAGGPCDEDDLAGESIERNAVKPQGVFQNNPDQLTLHIAVLLGTAGRH